MSKYAIQKILNVFRPSVPTIDPKRFVDREDEILELGRVLLAPSRHAVVYGERSVGKTSLVELVSSSFCGDENYKLIEYRCSQKDTFHLWKDN